MYMSLVGVDATKQEGAVDVHAQIYIEYILSGFLGLARYCFKESVDLSTDYVAELVFSLIYGNILTIISVFDR